MALILDLEDAVAPDAKARGPHPDRWRRSKAGGYGGRELIVRINGLNTRLGL